jgi:MYXO-CTERM domain-containing protein
VKPFAQSNATIFWAVCLIVAGLVILTQTTGLLPSPSGGVVGTALALGGLAVLASYLVFREHWWTLIAGPTVLALGSVILLPGDWGGAIFLGGIALGFALVAVTDVRRWWAVIPSGTLLTLAAISQLSGVIGGLMSGVVLFFGLAATFGVLALIRVEQGRMRWPLYPALGCLLFGMLIAVGSPAAGVVWPLALVALGAFFLIRATRSRPGPV